MIRKFIAVFVLIFFAASATAFAAENYIDWERGVIRVTGYGFGPASWDKKDSYYKTQARQTAQLDALRNIAELLMAINVTPASTVRDLALENEDVYSVLTYDVNRFQPVKVSTKFFTEGYCEVVLEIKLFGKTGLAKSILLPKVEKKLSFPKPSSNVSINEANYTGLVVDCRGLNINCVIYPAIKNVDGIKIYDWQNIADEKIWENGLVGYTNDMNDVARAGKNPLVVKAISLSDLNTSPVVSLADADKILAANQHDKFLEDCAVVFVK